jgi:N-acetylmuramoyl-L-alanine amidase
MSDMLAIEADEDPTSVTRRIAIVIGHNAKAQGTTRVTDGVTENAWAALLADEIQNLNPEQVRVFRRPPKPYPDDVKAAYAEVDAWGADVSCELHVNSADTPDATGTETLYATNAGKAVAVKVQAQMVSALGLRDRGLVHRATGNGSTSLLIGKAPAVMTEPYFASNPGDCRRADERFVTLARGIFLGLGGDGAQVPPVVVTLEERVTALEKRCDAAGI